MKITARIQKVLPMGSNSATLALFSFDDGREDPNTTTCISGPSSARQGNAIQMSFRWRADDGPTLNAGLVVL